MQRIGGAGGIAGIGLVAALAIAAFVGVGFWPSDRPAPALMRPALGSAPADGSVMLILRGIANDENPRGQLDDPSALEYARQLGYAGEVLDVAGNTGDDSPQVRMALERIRGDDTVTALYGFSGGGYNARRIWDALSEEERARIGKVVVIGSPGVSVDDFPGDADVLVKDDPPAGHLAGPKALLEALNRE